MNNNEIEKILQQCRIYGIYEEDEQYEQPTENEWRELENNFNCEFCHEFKIFINFMSKYSFPGDIYNVKLKDNNGNNTIINVYNHENQYPEWDNEMIPFYGIGNGDYFCIHKNNMQVYYYDHEQEEFEFYMNNFADWIKDLPNFLK